MSTSQTINLTWNEVIQSEPNFIGVEEELVRAVCSSELLYGYTFDETNDGYNLIFRADNEVRLRHFSVLENNYIMNGGGSIFPTPQALVYHSYSNPSLFCSIAESNKQGLICAA